MKKKSQPKLLLLLWLHLESNRFPTQALSACAHTRSHSTQILCNKRLTTILECYNRNASFFPVEKRQSCHIVDAETLHASATATPVSVRDIQTHDHRNRSCQFLSGKCLINIYIYIYTYVCVCVCICKLC